MKNQILVIDADTYELRKLREILTREGFNIITATSKETGLQLSKKIKFSFVLGKASTLGFENNSEKKPKRD
jgi:PleD family two-component response regulator